MSGKKSVIGIVSAIFFSTEALRRSTAIKIPPPPPVKISLSSSPSIANEPKVPARFSPCRAPALWEISSIIGIERAVNASISGTLPSVSCSTSTLPPCLIPSSTASSVTKPVNGSTSKTIGVNPLRTTSAYCHEGASADNNTPAFSGRSNIFNA